ncbi:MAG: GAF domain-containing SpoIIE family protein phosphatase [Planctomycetota bacterium]
MAFWKKRGRDDRGGDRSSQGGGSGGGSDDGARRSGDAASGTAPGGAGAPLHESSTFLRGDTNEDSRSLELLLHTIARVTASRDLETLLDYVVDSSIEATGAERGFLVLMDDESGRQRVHVARERGSDGTATQLAEDVKYSTTVVQRVVDEEEPIRTTVQKNAEDLELGNSVYDLKLRAVMCVPLVVRSDESKGESEGSLPRGALYVDSKAATRAFQPEDLALFHALAQHIAIALENAQLNLHSIERARLEKSLEIAAEIQSGLMPKAPPQRDGYDLFGWYRSAEHASGDFYDFVQSKDGGLAAVVGDVTGHGVGPALITATAQASLRAYARILDDPGAVVTMLNSDLSQRVDDGIFLTLFMVQLDDDGRVSILNAGHTPPLLWRASAKSIESIAADGPALGLMDDMQYAVGEPIQMEPGDVLLAFTDGLVEARHPDYPDRFFEEQGVRAVLSDAGHQGVSARDTVESVAKAALEFADGAREDDVTIVAIRRL